MTTTQTTAMPELPEPAHRGPTGTGTYFDSFTAAHQATKESQ